MKTLAVIACWLLPSLVRAATYYVATNGNNANDGLAPATAWLTISNAAYNAQAGDTVIIGNGTFAERVTTARNGSSGSPIKFQGSGASVMLGWVINHSHHIFTGFKHSGSGFQPFNGTYYITSGGSYSTISNNLFVDITETNIGVQFYPSGFSPFDNAGNCLIHANEMYNVKGTPFTLHGYSNTVCCNIVSNSLRGLNVFELFGCHNLISNNIARDLIEGGGGHPDLIQTFSTAGNNYHSFSNVIERNKFINAQHQLCMLENDNNTNGENIIMSDWTFRNNVFAEINYLGQVQIPRVSWLNNVFWKCPPEGEVGNSSTAFGHFGVAEEPWNTGHSARIINNAFVLCGTNLAAVSNRNCYAIDTVATNAEHNNNFVTTTNWQAVVVGSLYYHDADGINGGNPMFVDATNYDFRLLEGSPLIDGGTNLVGTCDLDFFNTARPVGSDWDIGLYEGTGVGDIRSGLLLHLNFDSLTNNQVTDVSGNSAHGLIYNTTNQITYTNSGLNASTAGVWTLNYTNPSYPTYPVSQYLAVTNIAGFQFLTNGTISVLAQFGSKWLQTQSCLVDGAYDPTYGGSNYTNSWRLNRFGGCTRLHMRVFPANSSDSDGVEFIKWNVDTQADTSTTNLNMYTVTFSMTNGTVVAYYNGIAQVTNTFLDSPWIKVQNYLCVGAAHMSGTPEWGDDNYPNDRFHYGIMDDLRIYNRVLSPVAVAELTNYTPSGITGLEGGGEEATNRVSVQLRGTQTWRGNVRFQ